MTVGVPRVFAASQVLYIRVQGLPLQEYLKFKLYTMQYPHIVIFFFDFVAAREIQQKIPPPVFKQSRKILNY